MNDFVTGINEEELSSLTIEILDYADRISDIFDRLDFCISKLPMHYQGSSCTEIINYYRGLEENYLIIKNNVISYSDDLTTLIKKVHENDKYISSLFRNYTEDTKYKIRSVEQKGGR